MIILYILFALISGWLGQAGGSGKFPRWLRIIGVPLMSCVNLFLCGIHNLPILFFTLGLLIASISTYWDFLFGYDNFWFHGFAIGIAVFLTAFNPLMFVLRWISLSLFMELWHLKHPKKFLKWDGARVEEFGRYFAVSL